MVFDGLFKPDIQDTACAVLHHLWGRWFPDSSSCAKPMWGITSGQGDEWSCGHRVAIVFSEFLRRGLFKPDGGNLQELVLRDACYDPLASFVHWMAFQSENGIEVPPVPPPIDPPPEESEDRSNADDNDGKKPKVKVILTVKKPDIPVPVQKLEPKPKPETPAPSTPPRASTRTQAEAEISPPAVEKHRVETAEGFTGLAWECDMCAARVQCVQVASKLHVQVVYILQSYFPFSSGTRYRYCNIPMLWYCNRG